MEEFSKWVQTITTDVPSHILGMFTAMIIAILRILYDRKEVRTVRLLLEASLCGALVLPISYGIKALGGNGDWSVFIGGVIGYLGPTTVRMLVLKFLNKRVEK